MSRRLLTAMLVAGLLGGAVGACGDSGQRESIEQSNQGRDIPRGTPQTVEENPSRLTPTGTAQPTVTQPPQDITENAETTTLPPDPEPQGTTPAATEAE
jgi:hypothetical protein